MRRKAFAYLRVSGKGQLDGDGFARQLAAIEQFAAAHEIDVLRIFREEGVSGTKELEDRPALQELLEELSTSNVRLVLVEKLDRLARDLMVQETIISDLQKSGYDLVSTVEPDLCSNDPSRKLVRQTFGSIAEYERAMIVLKLRAARHKMKAKHGRCEGKKPFGSRPGEPKIIERIRELRTEQRSFEYIATALDDEGLKPRQADKWNPFNGESHFPRSRRCGLKVTYGSILPRQRKFVSSLTFERLAVQVAGGDCFPATCRLFVTPSPHSVTPSLLS